MTTKPGRGGVAGVLAFIGVAIEAAYVGSEWGVKALGISIGAALILVALVIVGLHRMQDVARATGYVGSVLLALALAAAPPVAALAAGRTLSDWIRVYLAGAAGGLVLELIGSRGQVELPGPAKPAEDANQDPRRPLLPQVDLGLLARFILGGLAAVVVLMIATAAGSHDTASALKKAAHADLSIGWAIAIGSASSATWQAIAKMVQARLDTMAAALSGAHQALANADQSIAAAQAAARDAVVAPAVRANVNAQPALDRAIREAIQIDPNTVNVDAEIPVVWGRILPHLPTSDPELAGLAVTGLAQARGALDGARAMLESTASRVGVELK